MTKILLATAITIGLGLFSGPTFAKSYVVNGHAASAAEVQLLVSHGAQPGAWVVDGYGISPADGGAIGPAVESTGKTCWYVLDVELCN